MKNLLLPIFLFFSMPVFPQVLLGEINQALENSAALQVQTKNGILLPRLSGASLTNYSNPTNGLILYHSEQNFLNYYSGNWISIPTEGLSYSFPRIYDGGNDANNYMQIINTNSTINDMIGLKLLGNRSNSTLVAGSIAFETFNKSPNLRNYSTKIQFLDENQNYRINWYVEDNGIGYNTRNALTIKSDGGSPKIGIWNDNPTATLHIRRNNLNNGLNSPSVFQYVPTGDNVPDGSILTSNASGVASWTTSTSPLGVHRSSINNFGRIGFVATNNDINNAIFLKLAFGSVENSLDTTKLSSNGIIINNQDNTIQFEGTNFEFQVVGALGGNNNTYFGPINFQLVPAISTVGGGTSKYGQATTVMTLIRASESGNNFYTETASFYPQYDEDNGTEYSIPYKLVVSTGNLGGSQALEILYAYFLRIY